MFTTIKGYEQFSQQVPLNDYESLKASIDRMRHGERDVLGPGQVKWYAKSSGTTNDKSKFIPVSAEGLKNTHYAGGSDTVAIYLRNNAKSRLFDGRALILGGSHAPNYTLPHSLVGDLSAILIENINPLANLVRVPKKQTALLSDFEVKRDRIARETLDKNVTNPMRGHFDKLGVEPCRHLREVRVENASEYKPGDQQTVAEFAEIAKVDVTGTSKGKGFAGVIRRHGFGGGPGGHGSHFHRAPGSIGQCATPSRVLKGVRLPGHMGCDRVTVKNLDVVRVDEDLNIIVVKGAVPGGKNGIVRVRVAGNGNW